MKSVVVLGAGDGSLPTYRAVRALGLRAIGVDRDAAAVAAGEADEFVHLCFRDHRALGDLLADRDDVVAAVSPASDLGLPTVRALAGRLGLAGPSEPVVRASMDKSYFHHVCRELGLRVPDLAAGRDAAELAATVRGYPVIVKPLDASGSRGVRHCGGPAEVAVALPQALAASVTGTAVVEEYVRGSHHTVEGFMLDGRLEFAVVTGRTITAPPYAASTTHRLPSGLPAAVEAVAADGVELLCRRLDHLTGPVDVDLIVTPAGEIAFIEMGARVGGSGLTELVRHARGVDLVLASVQAAAELPVDLEPLRPDGAGLLRILQADRPGTLTAVRGLTAARAIPELADLTLVARRGDLVQPYTQAANKLGYAVLAAPAAAQVDAADERLARTLRFTVSPTGGTR